MSKESRNKRAVASSPPASLRSLFANHALGQTLATVLGLLFLFQCMILPLVGKAAVSGSGSPGAGPAEFLGTNQLFFYLMLVLTIAVGALAFASKLLRHKDKGVPFPITTATTLGLSIALLMVGLTGLLGI